MSCILDTSSIDLTLTGGTLSADLIIDPDPVNAATVTANGLFVSGPNETGWFPCTETFTYSSADDPIFQCTAVGDLTAKYFPGMRFRCTQTTLRYFVIVGVSFNGGTGLTTLTLYGGTDYDLAAVAIASPSYSTAKAPTGFIPDPTKWMVRVVDSGDRSKAAPVNGTWYLPVGISTITVPIGLWELSLKANLQITSGGAPIGGKAAISNNAAALGDAELSARAIYDDVNITDARGEVFVKKVISLAVKTVYNPIFTRDAGTAGSLVFRGSSDGGTVMQAVCAYL